MGELIPRTLISEIVGWRDRSLAAYMEATSLLNVALDKFSEAWSAAKSAHDGYGNEFHNTRVHDPSDSGVDFDKFALQLNQRCWMRALSATGLQNLMDHQATRELIGALKTNPPPFTEEAVYSALAQMAEDSSLIFARGLANCFSQLDRRFKSHDLYQFGSRIILNNMINGYGVNEHLAPVLRDVERVFNVLDGNKFYSSQILSEIRDQISKARQARRVAWDVTPPLSFDTEYFRVRTFQNGNVHLWFTRKDLVLKANKVLAEYYGAVLPDSVPSEADPVTSTALARDLSFYRTPSATVEKVLHYIPCALAGARVLEPSAGDGAFVRALLAHGAIVDAVEVHEGRVQELTRIDNPNLTVRQANFLAMDPTAMYDAVVMNPPFYGTHWMDHVIHAAKFLNRAGHLIAILPVSASLGTSAKHEAFRAWLARTDRHARFHDLPAESFAESGTRVQTCTLTLRVW